jgi:hypothetical protein
MELLRTIALLCQINGSTEPAQVIDKMQLTCQKYYVTCLNSSMLGTYKDLSACIKEKK